MEFDDKGWLGERNEQLGSFVRAAAGLLLKGAGWDWYYIVSPSELKQAILNVIPGHGIATWGGDEAVLLIADWLDPFRAVALGRAFQHVAASHTNLRIRIAREVWEWNAGPNASDTVRDDLGQAIGQSRVFYDWPKDRRPPRNDRDRRDGKLLIASPSTRSSQASATVLATTLEDAIFQPTARRADIIVANSVAELLQANIAGDLLIIIEDDGRAVTEQLDSLRVDKSARCVVRVSRQNAQGWLSAFGSYWQQASTNIDDVIDEINASTGLHAEMVVANQTFLLQSNRFLSARRSELGPSADYVARRSAPSGAPDEPIGKLQPLEAKISAPPPSKRVLNATVYAGKRRITVMPEDGQVRIEVLIQPKTPSRTRAPDFPEHMIRWRGATRRLQVHMVELGSTPVSRELILPRRGSSNIADFEYQIVRKKTLDLRLMVCDGPQILQTVRLKAKPGEAFEFLFETDFASLEREARPFDMALMVNDSLGGRPSATIVSPEGVGITAFDTGAIGALRDQARVTLETVVTNPALSLQSALMELANIGSELLDVIRDEIGEWPDDLERVQLTTKDNAFFPLEFLYDGIVPKEPDAPLCPQSKHCLRSDASSSCCNIRKDATVLCPLGFVGLRTIIERHVWSDNKQATMWLKQSVELGSRNRLSAIKKIAFAASDSADDFDDDDLPVGKKLARIQSLVEELAPRVETWDDWLRAVTEENLSMAILIAHIDKTILHIGTGEKLNRARLEFGNVPVALLLGCSSAVAPVASMSLPSRIMRRGQTQVVVSALTDILGRHANTAALYLGKQIRDASAGRFPVSLGEFIVRLRRELLADDIAAGLILVAIGDADIALGA